MKRLLSDEDLQSLCAVMRSIYQSIDERAAQIESSLKLNCAKGCCGCCLDDLSVSKSEASYIAHEASLLLETAAAHDPGRCAFLDDAGLCRIYALRPYVCRTHGLPLRWQDGDSEYRDICELNSQVDILSLEAEACFLLGPVEAHLMKVDAYFFKEGGRVKLRDLFHRGHEGKSD